MMTDVVNTTLSAVTATSNHGPCTVLNNEVTCTLGTLGVNEVATVVITFPITPASQSTIDTLSLHDALPISQSCESETTSVTGQSAMAVNKVDSRDPAVAGTPLS